MASIPAAPDTLAAHPPVAVFGLPIETAPLELLAQTLHQQLPALGAPIRLVTLNPEIFERALDDHAGRVLLATADFRIADGAGLVWAVRHLTGCRIPLVPGIELAHRLLELCAQAGTPVAFLGGAKGVAQEAAARLCAALPGLQIVAIEHGFHQGEALEAAIGRIADARPALVLVGTGWPRQEAHLLAIQDQWPRCLGIGVGGSFDVWAGQVQRAPLWMRKLKLEWLWRLVGQPARWQRMPLLLRFVLRVLRTQRQRS